MLAEGLAAKGWTVDAVTAYSTEPVHPTDELLGGLATADALTGDVAGISQFADDAMSRTFGDPDRVADVSQADGRVTRDAEQHLRVVGQERPRWRSVLQHRREISVSRHLFQLWW